MLKRVRFAPSPTGLLHPGNIRVAIQNYLLSKQLSGEFLLRLDDTDTERSTEEFASGIREDLAWLGLAVDAEVKQSDRAHLYDQAKKNLIAKGLLYPCYETPEELDYQRRLRRKLGKPPIYDRSALNLSAEKRQEIEASGTSPHWRFLLPHETITWDDMCKKSVSINLSHISDPVLIRADGTLTYLLASVVDDIDLNISHIVRGEDHITNTAVHIALARALQGSCPFTFAHTSLLQAEAGCVLSKSDGACSIRSLRKDGILPESVFYYLTALGASFAPSHKKASLKELCDQFDITQYSHASPQFSLTQLGIVNKSFLHHTPYGKLPESYRQACPNSQVWESTKENIDSLEDAKLWFTIVSHAPQNHCTNPEDKEFILQVINLTKKSAEKLGSLEEWQLFFKEAQKETSRKGRAFFAPIRFALTGICHGPCLSSFAQIIGADECINRLQTSL